MFAATASSSSTAAPVAWRSGSCIGPSWVPGFGPVKERYARPAVERGRVALHRQYRRRGYWLPETLPQRFTRVCIEPGGRVAVVDGDRRLSFAEVPALAERLASHLAALGVGPRD